MYIQKPVALIGVGTVELVKYQPVWYTCMNNNHVSFPYYHLSENHAVIFHQTCESSMKIYITLTHTFPRPMFYNNASFSAIIKGYGAAK